MTMFAESSGRVAVFLLSLVALIQVGIAVGLVSPNITWKASFTEWSWKLAGLSLLAASILSLCAWVVHQKKNKAAILAIAAYMVLNTMGNLTSDNSFERYGFGSITGVIAVCCAVVGFSIGNDRESSSAAFASSGDSNGNYGAL